MSISLRRLLDRLSPGTSARMVASVAVERDGRVLCVREGRSHKRDRWNLPGGRVDRGEAIIDAAVRETREETGVEVRPTGLGGIYRFHTRSNEEVILFFLFADVTGGIERADGKEILEVRWRKVDTLMALTDEELARPHLLRLILRDVSLGKRHSLELIRDMVGK